MTQYSLLQDINNGKSCFKPKTNLVSALEFFNNNDVVQLLKYESEGLVTIEQPEHRESMTGHHYVDMVHGVHITEVGKQILKEIEQPESR